MLQRKEIKDESLVNFQWVESNNIKLAKDYNPNIWSFILLCEEMMNFDELSLHVTHPGSSFMGP